MLDVLKAPKTNPAPNGPYGLLFGSWPVLALAGLCLILFFYKLGSYPFFDVDEPRYAETAREMLERNDWITPYFNYELRLNKPVMFYWLIAFSYQLFGISEFAARFFSALSAMGMVFITYGLGRWWINPRFGLFSALILATTIEVIGLSRMAIIDMTLAFFISSTIISLFLVAHHSKKWWLVAGLLSGLAILTKGPVGIILPGAIFVVYTLLTRQFKACFLNRWFPLALITSLTVALPWYIAAWQVHGQLFLDEVYHNNFSRFSGGINYHIKPWYFYLPVIAVGFMPWSLFLPLGVFQGIKHLKQPNQPAYFLSLFALIWAGLIFLFFSMAQTKLLTYVLPLFPALALLTGFVFEQLAQSISTTAPNTSSQWSYRACWILSGLLAVVLVILAPLFVGQPATFLPKIAQQINQLTENPLSLVAVASLALGSIFMTFFILRRQMMFALASQAIAFTLLVVCALNSILPSINEVTQGAMLSFAEQAKGEPLAIYEITRPSLTYYSRKKIPHVGRDDYGKLDALLTSVETDNPQNARERLLYIITKNSLHSDLASVIPKGSQLTLIDKQTVYSLFTLKKPKIQRISTP